MRELSPSVVPLLHLRTLAFLRELPAYQLTALAREAEELVVPRGTVLRSEREPAQNVYVILEGTAEARRGESVRRLGPGDEEGLLDVLAGEAAGTRVRAETDSVVLCVDGEALRTQSERYAALLLQLLGEVARRLEKRPSALLAALAGPSEPRPLGPELDRVGRLLALHRVPIFPSENMDALAELAGPRSELEIPAGEALWGPGSPARACYVLCRGAVRIMGETGEEIGVLRQGSVPGLTQVLRGGAYGPLRAEADLPVVALSLEREVFLDVVEDDFELGWSLLAGLASHVLSADLGLTEGG